MNLDDPVTQTLILYITVAVLSFVISLLLLYVVIRQGVFHGLRAHTRWIDDGKDYEPAERFTR